MCKCVYVCGGCCKCQDIGMEDRGQYVGVSFLLLIMWVLGIELRLSGL